jgi:hypothetical protein
VIDAGNGKQLKTIKEIVSKIRGDADSETVFETISYTKAQKAVVDMAIEVIVQQSGDTVDAATGEVKDISRGAAYERMAGDFLADPNNNMDEQEAEPSTFEDSHFVRDDEGRDYETGAE